MKKARPQRSSSSPPVWSRSSGTISFSPASRSMALPDFYGVRQGAKTLNLDSHLVPCLEEDLRVADEANAGRGTGQDEVSGHQGHTGAQERDQTGDREDHLRCRTVLHDLAVEHAPDRERLRVGYLVAGRYVRTNRSEGIYGLAPRPLPPL